MRTKYPISAYSAVVQLKQSDHCELLVGASLPSVKHPVTPDAHHPNQNWSSLK